MKLLILGAFVGSFMWWITTHSNLAVRSKCDHCDCVLKWYELIPIISFIMLRGKCHTCKQPIDISHFVCELLYSVCFLLFFQSNSSLIITLIVFLIPLAIYDTLHFKVPNHMLILYLFALLIIYPHFLFNINHLIGSCLIIFIIHAFYFLTKSIGYGDVKLFSLMALFLPWKFFFLIFLFTYLIGGMATIIFLIYKQRITKIPLVPFILASTCIVYFNFVLLHKIYFGGFLYVTYFNL